MDSSRYNKLDNTDKDIIFNNNKNITESNICEEVELESEFTNSKSNQNKSQNTNQKSNYKNNNSNFNDEILNKSANEKKLINNYILESKESLNNFNKNKSFSNCSQYADDIEDMNTIIKRLDFENNQKNEESIFKLNNKIYNNFSAKFKNEIEAYLFPQR